MGLSTQTGHPITAIDSHEAAVDGLDSRGSATSAPRRCIDFSVEMTNYVVPSCQAALSLSTTCPAALVSTRNYALPDMFFSPTEPVSRLSQDMPLLPGDVILCGTSLGDMPTRPGATVGGCAASRVRVAAVRSCWRFLFRQAPGLGCRSTEVTRHLGSAASPCAHGGLDHGLLGVNASVTTGMPNAFVTLQFELGDRF